MNWTTKGSVMKLPDIALNSVAKNVQDVTMDTFLEGGYAIWIHLDADLMTQRLKNVYNVQMGLLK